MSLNCISASPAALNRYLAAVPAMSLIPFAPFFDVGLALQNRHVRPACALFGALLLVTRDLQMHSNGVDEIVAY
jgi:hypothetical protein